MYSYSISKRIDSNINVLYTKIDIIFKDFKYNLNLIIHYCSYMLLIYFIVFSQLFPLLYASHLIPSSILCVCADYIPP